MSGHDVVDTGEDDIRDLFSYNLQRLAGISTRIALLSIKPRFDLNMHDWRALAVLDYLGSAPLHVLAQRAGVQKSQMSRTVAGLDVRGLIAREDNPSDGRSSLLMVTEEGRRVVRAVLKDSQARNAGMLRYLDAEERRLLMELLEKVTRGSLEVLEGLKHPDGVRPVEVSAPRSIFETEQI